MVVFRNEKNEQEVELSADEPGRLFLLPVQLGDAVQGVAQLGDLGENRGHPAAQVDAGRHGLILPEGVRTVRLRPVNAK